MTQQHMALEAKWLSGDDCSGDAAYSDKLYPPGVKPTAFSVAGQAVRDRPGLRGGSSERLRICATCPAGRRSRTPRRPGAERAFGWTHSGQTRMYSHLPHAGSAWNLPGARRALTLLPPAPSCARRTDHRFHHEEPRPLQPRVPVRKPLVDEKGQQGEEGRAEDAKDLSRQARMPPWTKRGSRGRCAWGAATIPLNAHEAAAETFFIFCIDVEAHSHTHAYTRMRRVRVCGSGYIQHRDLPFVRGCCVLSASAR